MRRRFINIKERRKHRAGFTLIEVLAAAGLIGVLFVVTVPLLMHVRLVRQEADRRQIAQEEAANVMESLAHLALNSSLTQSAVNELRLSPAAVRLPDAELTVRFLDEHSSLGGRQVLVRVTWTNDVGITPAPATLTAWFSAQEGN